MQGVKLGTPICATWGCSSGLETTTEILRVAQNDAFGGVEALWVWTPCGGVDVGRIWDVHALGRVEAWGWGFERD